MGDYLAWKRGYWRDLLGAIGLAELLDYRPTPARVLDVGCGPAGIFTVLTASVVDAVDPLLPRYDALAHFDREAYPHVRWFGCPIEEFTPEIAYDYVLCMNVLNHVRDIAATLSVLTASLRPGGRLVVSVDAHRYGGLRPLFAAVPGDVLHPHQYRLRDYEAMFARYPLREVTRLLYRREALFDYFVFAFEKLNR